MFLRTFRETGVIRYACEAADVHRTTVRTWKENDPAFAKQFEAAYDDAIDVLEREAIRRAFEGWDEPVFYRDQQVGVVRKYSDTLLIFLMKGARPQKYRDNARLELTGADGGPIRSEAVDSLDDHEKVRLRQIIDDALRQQAQVEADNG